MNKLNMKKIILYNCKIITESNELSGKALVVSGSIIDGLIDEKDIDSYEAELINCEGNYVLPGLIDIHSDVIEKIIVPRKSVVFNPLMALIEIDRELISQGITTMFHSISIAETTICDNQRTLKLNDMFEICEVINSCKKQLLINHKFHARFEINSLNAYRYIYQALCEGKIDELSFMDHTPGQGQYKDLQEFIKVIHQQYGNVTEDKEKEIIKRCLTKPKISKSQINTLIKKARQMNVPIAYHDVDSFSRVDWMINNGLKICEFPLNKTIAEYASQNGLCSIVGSPNVLLGHSHYKNANATELLQSGYADVLCSDYYSPSLLLSVFKLNREHGIPLYKAVTFASLNPAKAVSIDSLTGSISVGKIADLIIVDATSVCPVVTKAIINGKVKFNVER